MTRKKRLGAGENAPSAPDFDPVRLRYRRDGCTPQRQVDFIRRLAECGCVVEAARRVGLSTETMYALARRPDAQSFRLAWEIALDNAVRRIGDNAWSRALHGVAIPHYYKGELIGEHRRWDERSPCSSCAIAIPCVTANISTAATGAAMSRKRR